MTQIKYKLKEVSPNIFAVIIKDGYDRAMTFCRVQEYYESPNPKFRGKNFSIWDYIKWYSAEYRRGFTYASDWSGFNIPFEIAWNCSEEAEIETPYDQIMWEILVKIDNKRNENNKSYIIGAGDTNGWTFKHEVCHGLWYTNGEYKKKAKKILKSIKPEHFDIFRKNLLDMGYTEKVIDDEVQAYLMYGWDCDSFGKGVSLDIREMYNDWFSDELEVYIKNIKCGN